MRDRVTQAQLVLAPTLEILVFGNDGLIARSALASGPKEIRSCGAGILTLKQDDMNTIRTFSKRQNGDLRIEVNITGMSRAFIFFHVHHVPQRYVAIFPAVSHPD